MTNITSSILSVYTPSLAVRLSEQLSNTRLGLRFKRRMRSGPTDKPVLLVMISE